MTTTTNLTLEQKTEIIKCTENPIYFLENYFNVLTPSGMSNFKMDTSHRAIVTSVISKKDTIVLGPRQQGKTTIMIGITLWYLCFIPNKTIGITTTTGNSSMRIIREITSAYANLPEWIKPSLNIKNISTLSTSIGTSVREVLIGSGTTRGSRFDLFWCDDLQYISFNDVVTKINEGLMVPQLFRKQLVVTSSSGEYGSIFQWLWEDACSGKNDLNPIEISIDFDKDHHDQIVNLIGKSYFEMECANKFRVRREFVNPDPDGLYGMRLEEPSLKDLWKWYNIKNQYRKGNFNKKFEG